MFICLSGVQYPDILFGLREATNAMCMALTSTLKQGGGPKGTIYHRALGRISLYTSIHQSVRGAGGTQRTLKLLPMK